MGCHQPLSAARQHSPWIFQERPEHTRSSAHPENNSLRRTTCIQINKLAPRAWVRGPARPQALLSHFLTLFSWGTFTFHASGLYSHTHASMPALHVRQQCYSVHALSARHDYEHRYNSVRMGRACVGTCRGSSCTCWRADTCLQRRASTLSHPPPMQTTAASDHAVASSREGSLSFFSMRASRCSTCARHVGSAAAASSSSSSGSGTESM